MDVAAGARVVLLASLTALVAACGQDSPPADETAAPTSIVSTEDDPDRAQEMLLRLSDFSPQWEEDLAPDPEEGQPFGECPSLRRVGSTAVADSSAFTDGRVAMRHSVFMFESADVARSHMGVTRERMECVVGLFNSGAMDTADERFAEAGYDEVPFSQVIGDEIVVLRLGTLLRAGTEQGIVSADIITFQVGRSLHTLQGSLSLAPLRAGNMAPYAVIVADRAAGVLAEEDAR